MKKGFIIFTIFSLFGIIVSISSCKDDGSDDDTPKLEGPTPYDKSKMKIPSSWQIHFPADNPPTEEGVYLGRMLFYDPILSADSTQSCASCHNQQLAFTDNGRAFSVGIRGDEGTRTSMTIQNFMYHQRGFFWDGRSPNLKHQVLVPIEDPIEMDDELSNVLKKLNRSEMYKKHFAKAFPNSNITEKELAKALEQFLTIIVSGDSKYDKGRAMVVTVGQTFPNFTEEENLGKQIFYAEAFENDSTNRGGDCFHCHGDEQLFSNLRYLTNGLDLEPKDKGRYLVTNNPRDIGAFKVPSLRNIAVRAPFMHDGRFKTLDEVIDFYLTGVHRDAPGVIDGIGMHALQYDVFLSDSDKKALVSFLNTLTDETYLNNPEYSNPFK
jgi:cytochrome c peroxidase